MKNVDPSRVRRRSIMNGSDELSEKMTRSGGARQRVGQDLDGAHGLQGRLGD